MATKYPAQIDNSITLPPVVDNISPVQASSLNLIRDAVIAIQNELGTKPSGVAGTLKNRVQNIETSIANSGGISLSGDLGGTSSSVKVIGLQGKPISNVAPTNGQVLSFDGTSWMPSSSGGGGASPSNGTPIVVSGTAAAIGVLTTYARGDHQHYHGTLAGGSLHALADGTNPGFMSSANFTKLSGIAASSTTPSDIGTAAIGASTTYARADHIHAHGNQLGGTLHALVDETKAGFMSSANFNKLSAIPTTLSGDVTGAYGTNTVVSLTGSSNNLTYAGTLSKITTSGVSGTTPSGIDFRSDQAITASANTTVLNLPLISSLAQRFDVTIVLTSSSDTTKIATFDGTRLITYSAGTYTARSHANMSDVADDANTFGLTYTIDINTSNIRIRINTATTNLIASVFASLRTHGV